MNTILFLREEVIALREEMHHVMSGFNAAFRDMVYAREEMVCLNEALGRTWKETDSLWTECAQFRLSRTADAMYMGCDGTGGDCLL